MEEEQVIEEGEEDEEEFEEPQLYIRRGDKEVVELFHSQSEIVRKEIISKINEFDAWIGEREGLKDLPNVRMSIEIHNQIKNVINCLIKEVRIISKIKNQSITFKNNEMEKQKTKYENKIKKLEEDKEKLKEKKEMKLDKQQLEICKEREAGATISDLAKKYRKNERSIKRYWATYKGQNVILTEKPQKNISKSEKLNKGETNGTGETGV